MKKKFSYQQAYQNQESGVFAKIPEILYWLDDEHYLRLSLHEKAREQKILKINAANNDSTLFFDFEAINKKLPQNLSITNSTLRTKDFSGFVFDKTE